MDDAGKKRPFSVAPLALGWGVLVFLAYGAIAALLDDAPFVGSYPWAYGAGSFAFMLFFTLFIAWIGFLVSGRSRRAASVTFAGAVTMLGFIGMGGEVLSKAGPWLRTMNERSVAQHRAADRVRTANAAMLDADPEDFEGRLEARARHIESVEQMADTVDGPSARLLELSAEWSRTSMREDVEYAMAWERSVLVMFPAYENVEQVREARRALDQLHRMASELEASKRSSTDRYAAMLRAAPGLDAGQVREAIAEARRYDGVLELAADGYALELRAIDAVEEMLSILEAEEGHWVFDPTCCVRFGDEAPEAVVLAYDQAERSLGAIYERQVILDEESTRLARALLEAAP